MKISTQYAPILPNVNCFGSGNKKKFLVIHQTGNPAKGADAKMHAVYQINNAKMREPREASWHWSVDDKEAIQSFGHSISCFHASDGYGEGNLNGIAIEACINSDGDYVQTIKNTAELAAKILKEENIPLYNMKQHYDFARDKKNCPAQIRAGLHGITWEVFKNMVQDELDVLNGKPVVESVQVSKPVAKPVAKSKEKTGGVVKMSGVFQAQEEILVRDKPTTRGRHVATYYPGETLKYDSIHFTNGYAWLEYKRATGGKAYIPIAPVNEVWGSLK